MSPPRTIKDVQHFIERVAALNQFVSKSAECCLSFFEALKWHRNFYWNEECQKAFDDLKGHLSSPPLLAQLDPSEELLLYLAVSPIVMSAVLIQEKNRIQKPIYYVSWVLRGAKIWYTKLEKLAYALLIFAQKLQPYIQAHTVTLLTDQLMKNILRRSETSRWMVKWAIELSKFDIQFWPRQSIKAQVLDDFLVECTITEDESIGEEEALTEQILDSLEDPAGVWKLYVDRSSNLVGSGAGLLLMSPEGIIAEYALRFEFSVSNNEAEYEALAVGLQITKKLGGQDL